MREQQDRESSLYAVEGSNVSSTSKAIAEAKRLFCESTDYEKSEVRAKKIEESYMHDISDTILTIAVTVRYRVHQGE